MQNNKIISLLFLIIFYACAVQSPPTGGDADNLYPEVVKIIPINNSSSVDSLSPIYIYFNEIINSATIKTSFSIYPKTEIKIKYYRKRIEISPIDSWPDGDFKVIGSRLISDYNNNLMNENILKSILVYYIDIKLHYVVFFLR